MMPGWVSGLASMTPWIVGGVAGLVALFFVVRALRARMKVGAAAGWPSVPGTVLVSTVQLRVGAAGPEGGRSRAYHPVVVYAYTVGGRPYQGQRIFFGDSLGTGWPGPAQRTAARFPVGATVPVYYDPANPAQAVLERRAPANWLLFAIAGAILLFTLIGVGSALWIADFTRGFMR